MLVILFVIIIAPVITFLYIPVPSREVGLSLCRSVVAEKLAACGNLLGPMISVYQWKGEDFEEQEWALLLKTQPGGVDELRKRLEELHPYECPCIAEWCAEVNVPFGEWVKDQTG